MLAALSAVDVVAAPASFFLDFELEADIEGACMRTRPAKSAKPRIIDKVFFILIFETPFTCTSGRVREHSQMRGPRVAPGPASRGVTFRNQAIYLPGLDG